MLRQIRRFTAPIFSSLFLLLLVSCGGSGGGTDTDATAGRTGTVGILLTDKPADPSLFSAINATIVKVELMPKEDEDDRVSIYDGDPKTFDLLRLKNESIPLTFDDTVPVGSYCKIRLTLSDLELVLADDTPDVATDNKTNHPKLPGNGKLDLVVRGCFDVEEDSSAMLQLDIDAGKSIHITGNGKNKYKFRPVIFIDVIDQTFESKLVRLNGVITRVNLDERTLLLCRTIPARDANSHGCVRVHLGDDAAFFDNLDHAGAPRAIKELLDEDKLEEPATVIGRARRLIAEKDKHDDDRDNDHDGDVDDDEEDMRHAWMALDGLVVELGEFLQLEGTVDENADTDGFDMTVKPGSPVSSADALAVVLQAGSTDINGTRIISPTGELLDYTQIIVPRAVQVDGVLELSSDSMLKAALVIVDIDEDGKEQVTGTILSLGDDNMIIAPDADTVCGISSNQLFVTLDDDLDLLTVVITDMSSVITPGGSLEVGQAVGMTGSCEGSEYMTDNVVIIDDQR